MKEGIELREPATQPEEGIGIIRGTSLCYI
jgi:hypothetical protein